MSRPESKIAMGYLPIDEKHHPAILSLLHPATPAHRFLDPMAGEGIFAQAAAQAWNLTPYTNELDGDRAAACVTRFGSTNAVRCDVERLIASNAAFSVGWFNPPYDHDKTQKDNKRVEFVYLRHSWKWIAPRGIIFWCVYNHHLTEAAALFLAKNSLSVDVWALPGKHLDEYDQIVVVAIKGENPDPEPLYHSILAQKAAPRPLTVQPEPLYKVPTLPQTAHFVFTPDIISEELGQQFIAESGAWQSSRFQDLLAAGDIEPREIQSLVAPRPGHTTLVLAAGFVDGAVIPSEIHGTVALRGTTRTIEEIARTQVEADAKDPERSVTKTTMRLRPKTTLSLLTNEGTVIQMNEDQPMLDFITQHQKQLTSYISQRFQPLYQFDLNGMSNFLDGIRLNHKHPLYIAQKHVTAAICKGFERKKGILLVGQMGTGKTALGASASIGIGIGAAKNLTQQQQPGQVTLIVCPPHLVHKWEREARSIHPRVHISQINRYEDVKAFMHTAAQLPAGVAAIGIIKRDMTKLGSGYTPAVVWRKHHRALWQTWQPTPDDKTAADRILHYELPHCPTCHAVVMQPNSGEKEQPASRTYLKTHKLTCPTCFTPLWQDAREASTKPLPGQRYPRGNPRYRIDQYVKRFYANRLHLLIWDEVHEAQNGDVGNGQAFGRLAGIADHVLAMTGTPFNGRSSSLFNIEYHLNARIPQHYNWGGAPRTTRKEYGAQILTDYAKSNQRGKAEAAWVRDMGVREQVLEERPTYDSESGTYTGMASYERPYEEAPGISPLAVAEVLDHTIFFSLRDMAEGLPDYEEIACPVDMDEDIADEYQATQKHLKDYLIARRWEGDSSFRGAYLQWSMGWVNAPWRPYDAIHRLKNPFTDVVEPHTVRHIDSFGESRIYAKEQCLIDLVRAELDAGRPCVIYCRQTDTHDIQPRLADLLTQHLPLAKPYILRASILPDKREAAIAKAVEQQGYNIVISNPELVKTGLDLVFAPTLIFYEPVFDLRTMMQASGRSYRLSQKKHKLCKVIYMFYLETMEHTAIQLMSRKQRAAKLLLGELGLTGLEELTKGDSGFEEALLDAITTNTDLVDPSQLFKERDDTKIIDLQDAHFWTVAVDPAPPAAATSLTAFAESLGATITPMPRPAAPTATNDTVTVITLGSYLDNQLMIADAARKAKLVGQITNLILDGSTDGETRVDGIRHPDYKRYTFRQQALVKALIKLLRGHVARLEELTIANRAISLASQSSGVEPPQDVFTALTITAAHEQAEALQQPIPAAPRSLTTALTTSHLRTVITTALKPCLPKDASDAQRIDHDTHISAITTLVQAFIAETPIFWEDASDQRLIRDIRLYLLRNHVADRDTAASITNTLLPALVSGATQDAKRHVQTHKAAAARPASLDDAPAPKAPRIPTLRSFRADAEPPIALQQLTLFG